MAGRLQCQVGMRGALLLFAGALQACSQAGASQDRPLAVPASPTAGLQFPAEPKPLPSPPLAKRQDTYPAMVVARWTVELSASRAGRVDRIDVALGQEVQAQERIASLDVRSLAAELQIAQAQLSSAQAEERRLGLVHDQALATVRRMHSVDSGVVAAAEVEKADYAEQAAAAQLEFGKATVAERQAHIDQIRMQLEEAEIRAPFTGSVAVRYVDAGAFVQVGTPILRLISSNNLLIRLALPEFIACSIHRNEVVSVLSGGEVGSIGERNVAEAMVERIAPEVDAASH